LLGHVAQDVDTFLGPGVTGDAVAPAADAIVGVTAGAWRRWRWGGFVERLDGEVAGRVLEIWGGRLDGGALLLAVSLPGGALEREASVVAAGAQELGEGSHLGEHRLLGDAGGAALD